MPRVICTLPNASTNISGVEFSALDLVGGMISEEIDEAVAARFASINGYRLATDDEEKALGKPERATRGRGGKGAASNDGGQKKDADPKTPEGDGAEGGAAASDQK